MVAIGTTVIRRGEAGHGLVIVVRGRLELHADRSDGVRLSLGAIGPGDYVGEVGLLARAPATTQVVAAVDSELVVLPASDFYDVIAAFPVLWAELRSVAERRTRDHELRVKS
jgi:CRP-like cAMP-binding protein